MKTLPWRSKKNQYPMHCKWILKHPFKKNDFQFLLNTPEFLCLITNVHYKCPFPFKWCLCFNHGVRDQITDLHSKLNLYLFFRSHQILNCSFDGLVYLFYSYQVITHTYTYTLRFSPPKQAAKFRENVALWFRMLSSHNAARCFSKQIWLWKTFTDGRVVRRLLCISGE